MLDPIHPNAWSKQVKEMQNTKCKAVAGHCRHCLHEPLEFNWFLVFVKVVCQKARKKDEELHADLVSLQLTQSRLDWNLTADLFYLLLISGQGRMTTWMRFRHPLLESSIMKSIRKLKTMTIKGPIWFQHVLKTFQELDMAKRLPSPWLTIIASRQDVGSLGAMWWHLSARPCKTPIQSYVKLGLWIY